MGKLNFMLYGFNCVQGSSMRLHFSTMRLRWISATVYPWRFSWLYGFLSYNVMSISALCWLRSAISHVKILCQNCKIYPTFQANLCDPNKTHKTPSAFFIRNGDQKGTEYGIIDVNILPKLTTLVQLIPFLQPIGKPIGSSRNSLQWMAWFLTEDASVQC